MLIMVAGMEKSGSALFYNIINDLLVASGFHDARMIKKKYRIEDLMQWHNNNIGKPTGPILLRLWTLSLISGKFAVKTHFPPGFTSRLMSRCGGIKIIYSYRDPRDVVLSALDHGAKIRAKGETHTFASMHDVETAANAVKNWCSIWSIYSDMPKALTFKYEDLLEDPLQTVNEIADFLKLDVSKNTQRKIYWKYSKDNPAADKTGLHFNKAKVFRYKSEMGEREQSLCKETFGHFLDDMGYPN
jgi:hypothetical protein